MGSLKLKKIIYFGFPIYHYLAFLLTIVLSFYLVFVDAAVFSLAFSLSLSFFSYHFKIHSIKEITPKALLLHQAWVLYVFHCIFPAYLVSENPGTTLCVVVINDMGKLKGCHLERLQFCCFCTRPYLLMFCILPCIWVKSKAMFHSKEKARKLIIVWVLS